MKPFYQSKKIWATVVTALATYAATRLGQPDMVPVLAALGLALVASFGLADFGKEAKAVEFPPEE